MSNEKNDYFEDFLRNEILHFDADKASTGNADEKKADAKKTDAKGNSDAGSETLRRKPVANETIEAKKKEAMLSRVGDILGNITGTNEVKEENSTDKQRDNETQKKSDDSENTDEQREEYGDTDLNPQILRAIDEMGYKYMTPIQEAAIPVFLTGCDVIGQAQTGTGKTAAFGLPILQKVDADKRCLQALILCPTRELAMQAAEELHKFSKYMHGIKILAVYGGQDIGRQIRNLHDGVQIVVGTPGRVMDHIRRNTMKMETVRTVVLDEADEMLDMGFRDDIETILKTVEEPRQVALFSATMPDPILEITKKYQHDAKFIKMTPKEITIDTIEQSYYRVQRGQKREVLCRLMDYYDPQKALIFCNTKHMADDLNKELKAKGYDVDALHGDLSQNQRDNVMNAFRCGAIKVLLATDVAARGIDVSGVDDVFNYDVPDDLDYYVHRIGRTGRAGKRGRSITLVCGRDYGKIKEIERMFHTTVKERQVPSADEISGHKASKILDRAEETIKNGNIDKMIPYLEKKATESNMTMEQYAAAFLRQAMGDDLAEISFEPRRSGDRSGSYDDRGGRTRRGGNGGRSSDGRRSYSRDGSSDGRRRYSRDGSSDSRSSDGGRSYSRDGISDGRRSDGRRSYSRDGISDGRRSDGSERGSRGSDSRRRYDRDGSSDGRRSYDRDGSSDGRRSYSHDGSNDSRRSYDRDGSSDSRRSYERDGSSHRKSGNSYAERSGHEKPENRNRSRSRSSYEEHHSEDRNPDSWGMSAEDTPKRKYSHDHVGAPKTMKKDAGSSRKNAKSSNDKNYEPKNIRDVGLNGEPSNRKSSSGRGGYTGGNGGKSRGGKGRGGYSGDDGDFRQGRHSGLQIKTK